METAIIVAIISGIALIIAHNLPYIQENYGENIRRFFKLISGFVVVMAGAVFIAGVAYMKGTIKTDLDGLTSDKIPTEEIEEEHTEEENKFDNIVEAVDELLKYEPKITGISQITFNSVNEYYVQMISVDNESKAQRLTNIAKESFPNAYYKEVSSNKYRVILEEGKSKSIDEITDIDNAYNKEINRLLKENNEGSCNVWTPVLNKYIDDEINQIKLLIEKIEKETDADKKMLYKEKVDIIIKSIEIYLKEPLFNTYKVELEELIQGI